MYQPEGHLLERSWSIRLILEVNVSLFQCYLRTICYLLSENNLFVLAETIHIPGSVFGFTITVFSTLIKTYQAPKSLVCDVTNTHCAK